MHLITFLWITNVTYLGAGLQLGQVKRSAGGDGNVVEGDGGARGLALDSGSSIGESASIGTLDLSRSCVDHGQQSCEGDDGKHGCGFGVGLESGDSTRAGMEVGRE